MNALTQQAWSSHLLVSVLFVINFLGGDSSSLAPARTQLEKLFRGHFELCMNILLTLSEMSNGIVCVVDVRTDLSHIWSMLSMVQVHRT